MSTRDLPGHRRDRKTQYAFRSLFIVVLAATGFFAATALPSSATGTQPVRGTAIVAMEALAAEKADFSTLRGIKRYLREIGVDPRSVVIQRGKRNYAGPNCPGAAWSCTNAQQVMQLGTQNTFECSDQVCITVQPATAAKNFAKCIQKSTEVPFVRQRCSITQTGTHNEAIIVQVADQTGGAIQGVLQEAGLLQNATASTNRLQVDQEIKQFTETGPIQDQDAYQVVAGPFTPTTVSTAPAQQLAVALGDNASQIVQRQIQRAKGGATQTQNDGEFGADAPFEEPDDCHTGVGAISAINPNACVNLEQEAFDGTNHQGQLSQSIDQEETTTVVGAVQKQNPAKFTGGTDGRVHQVITGTSGTSQNQATQSETLKMVAPSGAIQDQHGGASCCGFGSQLGGVGNSEQIQLQKDLDAFGGTKNQTATLVGTSSSPQGTCAVSNNAQTNNGQSSESASDDGCVALAVVTNCDENACQDAEVAVCEPGEEPDVFVGEGDISVTCEEDGDPTISISGITEPVPLSPTPLDSQNRPRSLSSLLR
jgi:hypothetical protein